MAKLYGGNCYKCGCKSESLVSKIKMKTGYVGKAVVDYRYCRNCHLMIHVSEFYVANFRLSQLKI